MEYKRTRRGHGLPAPLRLPAILAVVVLLLLAVWAFIPKQQPVSPPVDAPTWVEQALLPINEYSRPGDKLDAMNGIVIHYTGNPGTTARQNRDYFAGLAKSHADYISSNFVVGLEGEALQAVPSDEVAYASGKRNNDTLSIEVCHPDDTGKFSPETTETLVRLVQWLVDYYRLERNQIIRHFDVSGKECPRWFVQYPEDWEAFLDQIDFSHTPKETTPADSAGAGKSN